MKYKVELKLVLGWKEITTSAQHNTLDYLACFLYHLKEGFMFPTLSIHINHRYLVCPYQLHVDGNFCSQC